MEENKLIEELHFSYGQSMDSVWKELVLKINEIINKLNEILLEKELEMEV